MQGVEMWHWLSAFSMYAPPYEFELIDQLHIV